MTLLAFDGSELDTGVDYHLHRSPDLETYGSELDTGVDSHLHRMPTVVREGMFAVVDGMDLLAGEALRTKG
ncbi:hypothetical protein HID58_089297 [Brassica napus]|uniref:Uncharacterized protein n=1 Tax=Brassica napus TaxID=3708 RepID=A0ABQ7XYR4_BRANA|nr:hypothetical protein HID58_089297 [Brassica napus]